MAKSAVNFATAWVTSPAGSDRRAAWFQPACGSSLPKPAGRVSVGTRRITGSAGSDHLESTRMDGTIRWLHLTDLHVGMSDQDWLWPRMQDKFHEDLQRIRETAGPWDLVLFTGDLVQKGTEYARLEEIFAEMWSWFEELQPGRPPQLLAVPGNHDLQWRDAKDPPVKMLHQWAADADVRDGFWNQPDGPYRQTVKEAFADYEDWWQTTPRRPDGITPGSLPGDFSYTFTKAGLRLGIVGLNSAFLQLTEKKGKKGYLGQLVLDPRQFQAACGGNGVKWAKSHDACFLMTHHPPPWLNKESREYLNGEVMESFCLHLCGHNHETDVLQELTGGADKAPLRWLGRSLFGLEKPRNGKLDRSHGYAAGELRWTDDGSGCLQFMPRQRAIQGATWRLVPDQAVDLRVQNERTREFPIRLRPARGETKPSLVRVGFSAAEDAETSGVADVAALDAVSDEVFAEANATPLADGARPNANRRTDAVRPMPSPGPVPEVSLGEPDAESVSLDVFREAVQEKPLLLMTAVRVELNAVSCRMRPLSGRVSLLRCFGRETYFAGMLGAYRVIVTMCGMGAAGRDGVIATALDAIDAFKPGAVIMAGIAFGADSKKQNLGDVMVASQIIAYELSRVGESLTISRGPHSEAGATLLNRFRHAGCNGNHRVGERTVKVHVGPMVSGDKLIDNKEFKARLLQEFPKAIGGDMEGAGLYAAAARRNCEWIVVKGIADWADGSKTKEWQPFSALAAATLVEAVLTDPFSLAELSPVSVIPDSVPLRGVDGSSERRVALPSLQAYTPPTMEAAKRARYIMVTALTWVCETLNADRPPFPSLREGVFRQLSNEESLGSSLTVQSLEQLLKDRLMELMTGLWSWLEKQKEPGQAQRLREIIDVFAAAGMDSTWIQEMTQRLEGAHIEAPRWTDIHLCEPVLTALFGEPATWVRERHIDDDFMHVEAAGTDPESRRAAFRRHLAARHFGQHFQRSGGESDEAYERRRREFIDSRLPRLLKLVRKNGKPYFLLYDQTAKGLIAEMERDPQLWNEILKIELRSERDGVILDDVELGYMLRDIFARLDELCGTANRGVQS